MTTKNIRFTQALSGISLPDYEAKFFDREFNAEMFKAIGTGCTVDAYEEVDSKIKQTRTLFPPTTDIPWALRGVFGGGRTALKEHIEYTRGTYHGEWTSASAFMPSSIYGHGTLDLHTTADGGVEGIVEGELNVDLWMIGGAVADFVEANMNKNFADRAAFTQKWIDEHPAVPPQAVATPATSGGATATAAPTTPVAAAADPQPAPTASATASSDPTAPVSATSSDPVAPATAFATPARRHAA
jgi:hypothetical protein